MVLCLFFLLRKTFFMLEKKFCDFFNLNKLLNDEFSYLFLEYRYRLFFFVFMDLTVGRIVWARRDKEDIYWPGKIILISDNTNNLWSSESLYDFQQQCNYLVDFFITNQSAWITDILPYLQYRDSMTNDSFMTYGLHSTIKPDFLNAIHQADYASNNEIHTNSNDLTTMTTQQQDLLPTIEDNTDNDFLLASSPMFTSNTGD